MDNDWAEFRLFWFLWVAMKHRNFRFAAEELHTVQSNLSAAAKQFHEASGIRLYQRRRDNRIYLTRAGAAFIEMVPALFATRDDLIAALKAIDKGGIDSLRFGCGTFVDPELFRQARAIHRRYLPDCVIHPTHADSAQLANEVITQKLDAAIVTLPVEAPELHIEELRRDRLVACLRADDPLASKTALPPSDLGERPVILYHPERHPAAHARLVELLAEAGVFLQEHSRASHPSDMQEFVLEDCGLALVREGTSLQDGLITRVISGVTWTVDTAMIYRKDHHPKTLPVLVRELKKRSTPKPMRPTGDAGEPPVSPNKKQPDKINTPVPEQLSLLDELFDERLSA